MKIFVHFRNIFLIGLLCSVAHFVFAENDNIELTLIPSLANTELNIKGAKLIETYLIKYTTQLKDFKEKNGIPSDKIIDEAAVSIQKMIYALRKIQTDKLEKVDAEKVMSKTIEQIKELNRSLKIYLKNKDAQIREEARIFQESLDRVVAPFQKKLEKLIASLKFSLSTLPNSDAKKKKIMSYLSELENENIRLKSFRKLTFKSKRDIKDYVV